MIDKTATFRAVCVFIILLATLGGVAGRQEHHKNLSCYMCHTLTHGEFCQNFMAYQNTQILPSHQCPEKELFCMVRRYSFSANGTDFKVWMMERNCTRSCRNECVITGDRSKLHLCTSCCEHNYCNIGNMGASSASYPNKVLLIGFLIFVILVLV